MAWDLKENGGTQSEGEKGVTSAIYTKLRPTYNGMGWTSSKRNSKSRAGESKYVTSLCACSWRVRGTSSQVVTLSRCGKGCRRAGTLKVHLASKLRRMPNT